MADPILPHLVSGKVNDVFGGSLASATVTLTHATIGPILSTTSDSNGDYILNLSGLNSQWSDEQTITVTGTKTAEGTGSTATTIQGIGSQTVNVTLSETSDLNFDKLAQDRTHLFFALISHFDGLKVTRERGIPVHTVLERQYTQTFTKLSGGQQVEFQGWANPGSSKDDAVWRIRRLLYDGTFPTDIVWANGNQNFDNIWNDRESLDYS